MIAKRAIVVQRLNSVDIWTPQKTALSRFSYTIYARIFNWLPKISTRYLINNHFRYFGRGQFSSQQCSLSRSSTASSLLLALRTYRFSAKSHMGFYRVKAYCHRWLHLLTDGTHHSVGQGNQLFLRPPYQRSFPYADKLRVCADISRNHTY